MVASVSASPAPVPYRSGSVPAANPAAIAALNAAARSAAAAGGIIGNGTARSSSSSTSSSVLLRPSSVSAGTTPSTFPVMLGTATVPAGGSAGGSIRSMSMVSSSAASSVTPRQIADPTQLAVASLGTKSIALPIESAFFNTSSSSNSNGSGNGNGNIVSSGGLVDPVLANTFASSLAAVPGASHQVNVNSAPELQIFNSNTSESQKLPTDSRFGATSAVCGNILQPSSSSSTATDVNASTMSFVSTESHKQQQQQQPNMQSHFNLLQQQQQQQQQPLQPQDQQQAQLFGTLACRSSFSQCLLYLLQAA
ncbi:hypothetical protein GQ42DRAFT_154457 [Ramicandelaber brevisporus]|nr:hypothetical protein GQ42DRAFT_154457 [Ramicandelaber brevisporus]